MNIKDLVSIFDCGCGGGKIDWEKINRELEETDPKPIVIPVETPIEVPDWPVRKNEEVEVD